MHEVGIAKNIVEVIQQQIPTGEPVTVKSIRIRVGALARVTPQALRFGFEMVTQGTPLHGAILLIEEIPLRGFCRECQSVCDRLDPILLCGVCGSTNLEITSGNELDVKEIELVSG